MTVPQASPNAGVLPAQRVTRVASVSRLLLNACVPVLFFISLLSANSSIRRAPCCAPSRPRFRLITFMAEALPGGYSDRMLRPALQASSDVAAVQSPQVRSRLRSEIPDRFKRDLDDIFPDWATWEAGYKTLEAMIPQYAALKGSLSGGANRLLDAFRLSEEMGQLAYRVWYFPSLQYDEDQRDNGVNAKRQQVQILFARLGQAESWFNPELLSIPLAKVRGWMDASPELAVYRFAIENLYRQQEHVLDEGGEKLMSLASRLASAPNDACWALSTADAKFPKITLST